MKICPTCKTRYKDTALKCRYCNEMLISVPASKKRALKYRRKRKKKTFFSIWQERLKKIWTRYWYWAYIISIVIAILVLGGQLVSRNLDLNKEPEVKPSKVEINPAVINPVPKTGNIDEVAKKSLAISESADGKNSASDWNNKAIMLWGNDKYSDPKKAIEYLNNAIEMEPDFAKPYNNRGLAHYNLGEYQKAVDDFSEALRIKPDYDNAYLNRGNTYLQMGNNNLACSDLQKACELGKCELLENAKKNKICRGIIGSALDGIKSAQNLTDNLKN
ncbi:MAG: tetratricopeptide repeat protein [Syntrophaceae bacterium]|nr:tetratricopeptide repeat protein [Syntrophaceae bacterium]